MSRGHLMECGAKSLLNRSNRNKAKGYLFSENALRLACRYTVSLLQSITLRRIHGSCTYLGENT